MRITIFLIFLTSIFIPHCILSQNLVINGDFEDNENGISKISGTPDIVSYLGGHLLNPPQNKGLSYLGLAIFNGSTEAIQLQLKQILKKGIKYNITISVVRPKFACPTGLKKITCAFSAYTFQKTNNLIPINAKSCNLYLSDSSLITDSDNWMDLKTSYIANGTEKYLILGNIGNANLDIIRMNKDSIGTINTKFGCNYFYYDNIILTESKEKIIVKNINFKLNSHLLENSSQSVLDSIINSLKLNTYSMIKIVGHTDNIGSFDKNMILSLKRAESVKNYFIEKGILGKLIEIKGCGSSIPLNQNRTLVEQAQNRRVEFFIE